MNKIRLTRSVLHMALAACLPAMAAAQHRAVNGDETVTAFIKAVNDGQTLATATQAQVTAAGAASKALTPDPSKTTFTATAADLKVLDTVVAAVGTAQSSITALTGAYPQVLAAELLIHTKLGDVQKLDLATYKKQYPTLAAALANVHVAYGALETARTGIDKVEPSAKPKPAAPSKSAARGKMPAATAAGATPPATPPTGLDKDVISAVAYIATFLYVDPPKDPLAKPIGTSLASSLKPLADEATANGAETLVRDSKALTPLENALNLRIQFKRELDALAQAKGLNLKPINDADKKLQDVTAKLLNAAPLWSLTLAESTDGMVKSEKAILDGYVSDPGSTHVNVTADIRDDQAVLDNLAKTTATQTALLADLQNAGMPSDWVNAPDLVNKLAGFWTRIGHNATTVGVVLAQLGQDRDDNLSSWTQDEIRLYYFDNVPRLIQFLNPSATQTGGNSAQTTESQSRATLEKAGMDAFAASQAMANAKISLQEAQNQLDAATKKMNAEQAALDAANVRNVTALQPLETKMNAAQRKLDLAKATQTNDQATLTQATTAQQADPTNPAKVASMQLAQAAVDSDARKVAVDTEDLASATQAYNDAKTQQSTVETSAQTRVTALQTQVNTLQTQYTTAQQAEATASSALTTARENAFLAAALESRNFAAARDNAPFWVAQPKTPILGQTDPVQRVMLYGSPDSKTLFIRGRQEDIDRVKQMVQKLDRPEAQAEMTLYTIQINSDTSKHGVKEAQAAGKIVQDELIIEKTATQTASDLLCERLNNEFAQAHAAALKDPKNKDLVAQGDLSEDEASSWRTILAAAPTQVRDLVRFYGLDLLADIGLKPGDIGDGFPADVILDAIPRPQNTATMAEALVAIALTDSHRRCKIVGEFEGLKFDDCACPELDLSLKDHLKSALVISGNTVEHTADRPRVPGMSPQSFGLVRNELAGMQYGSFINLERIVGLHGTGPEILSLREDVLTQLKLRLPGLLTTRIKQNLQIVEDQLADLKRLNDLLSSQSSPSEKNSALAVIRRESATVLASVNGLVAAAAARGRLTNSPAYPNATLLTQIYDAIDALNTQLNRKPIAPLGQAAVAPSQDLTAQVALAQGEIAKSLPLLQDLLRTARSTPTPVQPDDWYDRYHAQLARANETLIRLMHGIDDDVKANFVNPMVERLGSRLLDLKLGVGLFQKTTILASNRLIANVDPQASAEFAGQTDNPLQDLTNFMTLFGGAVTGSKGSPGSLTGPLAAALAPGAGAAVGTLGAVKGFAGAASSLPANAPPAVYGVTSGNSFTVTPVFDPTGQALRFRLDFLSSTQIRESDNSLSPAFPRIERHSVNTEVRLSNFETANVSEFLVNSRLGKPAGKWGGIPFFKDIYPFSQVPIIGWFTKREAQFSEVQQSLILTQTSMYPTIQDIIELLTSSGSAYAEGK